MPPRACRASPARCLYTNCIPLRPSPFFAALLCIGEYFAFMKTDAPDHGKILEMPGESSGRGSHPRLHVAIIMDGNGRWAARRGLPRAAGHRAGLAAARRIVEHAPDIGIRCLTLYAFSSDNWRRPSAEVKSIFLLLRAFLRLETERMRQRGARLEVIGRRDRLPGPVLRSIEKSEWVTSTGRGIHLRVAIDYSSRDAIAMAAAAAFRALSTETEPSCDRLRPMLSQALAGQGGEVDLLIRTGGEK